VCACEQSASSIAAAEARDALAPDNEKKVNAAAAATSHSRIDFALRKSARENALTCECRFHITHARIDSRGASFSLFPTQQRVGGGDEPAASDRHKLFCEQSAAAAESRGINLI